MAMTLDAIYNNWLSLQPLTEAEQKMLSKRFTVFAPIYKTIGLWYM